MPLIKFAVCSAVGIVLAIAAVAICSFDASDIDIARPPSLEKSTGLIEPQSNMATFIANPLDRYAVYLLSRDPSGNPLTSDQLRLLLLAAGRSLRDIEIQSAAISQFLKEERYSQALERLDGLIRSKSSIRNKLYDALTLFTQSAGSRRSLVELLAQNPPWRKNFFTYLPRSAVDMQTASTLIADLRSSKSPPRSSELAPFISKLIADGSSDQAYYLWLNSLTEAQLARAGYIFNGDFEAKLAEQGPFDWIVVPAKNVVARTVWSTAADRGTVLEVAFAGAQISYRNVYQRMMLSAGRYRLTGYYKASNLENDRGFVWRISCEAAGQPSLGESPPMKGTQDWGPFEISFSVPDKDCTSQLLRLELNARAKLDLRVRGVLSFDDLKVDRQE